VRCDSLETVEWLLAEGLSGLMRSHNGRTPLHVAALHGRLRCARALLFAARSLASAPAGSQTREEEDGRQKDLVLSADCGGMIAFHEAAAGGHVELLRLLLDAGTQVDHADSKGRTALLCAAEERHYGAVAFLMAEGATAQRQHRQVLAAIAREPQEAETPSFLTQAIMKVSPLACRIIETHQARAAGASSISEGSDVGAGGGGTGKQRRKEKRRQRKEGRGDETEKETEAGMLKCCEMGVVWGGGRDGLRGDSRAECGAGWQHGVFLVPAVPPSQYPATCSLMQQPYPWGELHVSCYAFVPALPAHTEELVARELAALPAPVLEPVEVAEKAGWRRNLVLAFR
jgi:hypothetical protein